MKVVFAGTPDFAATALEAIIAAGHEVVLVLTQPDRPAGRGLRMVASAVKMLAERRGLPICQPQSLKDPDAQQSIRAAAADVMVVAAYGLILPQAVLDLPRLGCVNIHASLLPRWRGAAPVQRAIEAGDRETGVTIMQMDAGLDTGAILERRAIAIAPEDTAATLETKLARLGGELIVEVLARLTELQPSAQPREGATYAAKIGRAEAVLDWRLPAALLARRVRAFNPHPGAAATWAGTPLKIWDAVVAPGAGEPGRVLAVDAQGIVVACGECALRLRELQKAGGRRLPAGDFLRGFALCPDQAFSLPEPPGAA